MECLKSGLSIFFNAEYKHLLSKCTVTYKQIAPADNPAQLEFNCSGHSDYYIDLNSVRLLVRLKLVEN
jgi:hypothetical protein